MKASKELNIKGQLIRKIEFEIMKQNVKTVSGRKETTDQPKKKTKVEEYVVNPDKVSKFTRGTKVKTKVSMRSYSLT